jgi:hypothetical protein
MLICASPSAMGSLLGSCPSWPSEPLALRLRWVLSLSRRTRSSHFFLNRSRHSSSETVVDCWRDPEGEPGVGEDGIDREGGCLKKARRRDASSSWCCRGVVGGSNDEQETGDDNCKDGECVYGFRGEEGGIRG